jgi:hypothetical protein
MALKRAPRQHSTCGGANLFGGDEAGARGFAAPEMRLKRTGRGAAEETTIQLCPMGIESMPADLSSSNDKNGIIEARSNLGFGAFRGQLSSN